MFKKYSYTLIAILSLLIACSSPEQILAESISSEAGITFLIAMFLRLQIQINRMMLT
ncbi:hypothetical protein AAGG43_24455 [Bacillus paranthracis]